MSGRFKYGVRFELIMTRVTEEVVKYKVSVSFPEGPANQGELQVVVDTGAWTLVFNPDEQALSAWMQSHLESWCGTVVRGGLRSGKWPRRLQQWKAEPESIDTQDAGK
jgi:hypothetical protein